MPGKKLGGSGRSFFKRRNVFVFGLCLLISTLFWFLLAFNGHYSATLKVPVEYINMPKERMLIEKLPTEVEITISGSGYQLISYWMQPKNAKVLLDGRNIGTKPSAKTNIAFLTTYTGIDFFNREHGDVKALHIQPDTLFLSFFNRGSKKVPVRLDLDLGFQKQYYFTDSIHIQPDSITISGPITRLDSIHSIYTEQLKLRDVNKSASYTLKLIQNDSALAYEPSSVDVRLSVDQFTEVVFDIPIRVEHLLSSDSLDIFPNTIQLSCLVALKNFSQLKPSSFIVAADAFDLRNSRTKSLKLYLRQAPDYVKNVQLKPESVEFIIRMK
jgi:YbbR domain-containing protein